MSTRSIFLITIFSMIFASTALPGDNSSLFPSYKNLTGDEPVLNAISSRVVKSALPDSPGEIVGYTQWEYQTNGSTGNRCAADTEGGVHFTWMKASGGYPPPQRSVFYNYVDPNELWLVPQEGMAISQVNGAGFSQIALHTDNLAGVAYHSSASNFVIYAQDNFPGFGIFSYFDPPDFLSLRCYWPYVAIDINDRIHIVMRENPAGGDVGAIGYTRSGDDGLSWLSLVAVDTNYAISQTITASPVSGKVAIVYTHPAFTEFDRRGDVYYIESEDGINWDWENGKVNITEYGAGGDSLFAYTDVAPIYDYDDNLHVIWNAWRVTEGGVGDSSYLYHYDYNSGITSLVNAAEFPQDSECETGAWSQAICKMSLGVHEESGGIFTAYTLFNTSDCSAGGYANGEVFMQYSSDNGLNWSEPENLTDSPTPGCDAGDCDSDVWPSLADRVDDDLHIMYIDDKDAGAVVQSEGVATDNPVMYLAVPNPLLSFPETADILGHITVEGRGLLGIPIDLADSNGALIASTASDETGFYRFEEVLDGEYSVSISTPLGYTAEEEWQAVFMEGVDVTVDFDLTAVDIVDDRRGVGFWKHQLTVYLFDRGHPQIPEEEFRIYLGNINIHFNNNTVNPVELYSVEQPGTPTDSLEAAHNLLSLRAASPMHARATRQLMAVLLNIVSSRLHQQTVVSQDGATASQALTFCYDLITNDDDSDDETAKDIAGQINGNTLVPADMIPLTTPDISYRIDSPHGSLDSRSFSSIECFPNPFNSSMVISYYLAGGSEVSVSIYNLLGQRVAIIFEGAQDTGEHSIVWDASAYPSGVYFARLEAGRRSENVKMVLLR